MKETSLASYKHEVIPWKPESYFKDIREIRIWPMLKANKSYL